MSRKPKIEKRCTHMARKDVTSDVTNALGNEQRLDALIIRLDRLAERVTKVEDGRLGTDRCLIELYKAVGKLSEALDVKLDEGADMAQNAKKDTAVEPPVTITHDMQKTLRMAANDANVAEAKANRALEIVTDLQKRMGEMAAGFSKRIGSVSDFTMELERRLQQLQHPQTRRCGKPVNEGRGGCENVSDTSKSLRKAADEIENEGHLGWGNTCRWAADEFDALASRLAEAEIGHARYEYVRRLNVNQFRELFVESLHGARFDDLVDAARSTREHS